MPTSTDLARRQLAYAITAITVVWLLAWSRWLWADAVVPWDSKNQFYAFFRFLAAEIHAGRAPFWNPYHYGGHPSIADPQSLVFQPVFVAFAWFNAEPSLRAFDFLVLAHLLVGGLAIAGLGDRRGWPAPASVVAAAVFMLGGAASARLNHTGIITCYGLFPLALLWMEIAFERRSLTYAAGFGTVAAMILLGRNQVALMLAMVLAALALREVLNAPAPLAYLRSRLGVIAAMALTILALVAVPLMLTLQLAALSNRPEAVLKDAYEASLFPANLASMAVANIFGQHSGDYFYWGPNAESLPDVAATDDSFNYLFIGAAPVILILWLGVASGRLGSPGRKTWGTVVALALMFSLGRYTPVFGFIFEHVPGFAFFRRPIDGVFILGLGVALLAGELLAEFVRKGLPALDPLRLALVLASLVAVLASALALAGASGHGFVALKEIARAVPVVAAAIVALVAARTPGGRMLAACVLAALTAAELVAWNAASRLNAEARDYYQVLDRANAEDTDALRVLSEDIERRLAEGQRPRVAIAGIDGPWQNLAIVRGIEATNGYNPLRIGLYDKMVSPGEIGAFLDERVFPPTFPGYDSPLAMALGLEYLVIARPIAAYPNIKLRPGTTTLRAGPKVWIYRLGHALPRVRFSSRFVVVDAAATLPDGSLVNPPTADRVVIDQHTSPIALHPAAGMAGEAGGTARITAWAPGRVAVEVEARTAGLLVLADAWYPGWVAELDGRRVPILRADVLFRAIEVPAGRHTTVFSYRPLSLENLVAALTTRIPRTKQPGWR